MSNVSNAIQRMIKEDLQPGIGDALVEIDSTFKEVFNSSMGVERDNIGRNWIVIKTLLTSLAGSFKAVGAAGGDSVVSTSTPYTVHSAPSTFDGVSGFVSPGYIQKQFNLQEYLGNMQLPHEFLRADQLTASIGSAVAAVIQQTARNIALVKANHFLTPDQTNKTLATTGTVAASGTNGTTTVTYNLSSTTRIRNLQPGMQVDIWKSDASELRNSSSWSDTTGVAGRWDAVIYSVDPVLNQVRIDAGNGSSTFATSHLPATGDLIVLKSSLGNGTAGLESWLLATGTLYTNLSLVTYPQLKSVVVNVAGSLTDDVLRKTIAGFIQGHGAGAAPDTLLTTEGVLNDYIDQLDGDRRWVVQGEAQKVVGGYDDGVKFVLNGRVFNFKTGSMVAGGRLYGVKLRDKNIKRYMPPKLPGSSSRTEFDNIEFVAPLGGSKDIWKHSHYTNGATTKYVEAPFVSLEEIVPDVIPGIKLYGLTEDLQTS